MSVVSEIIACPKLQDKLDTYFTKRNMSKLIESTGLLQFLLSDVNRKGVNINDQVSPGNGKIKTVELLYTARLPESEAKTDSFAIECTSSNKRGNMSKTYSIDPDSQAIKDDFFVTNQDLTYNCATKSDWILDRILDSINLCDRRIATKAASQAASLTGAFVDDTNVDANDVKEVQTQDSSGNNLQNLLEQVQYNSSENQYERTIMFGNGELDLYMHRVMAACCANSGTNLMEFIEQNPLTYIKDYRIENANAFTKNHFMTMTPGAIQPIWYHEFSGDNVINEGNMINRVIVSPDTGIPYDLYTKVDCQGGEIGTTFGIRVAFKFVGMPEDMFCPGDRQEGNLFVNEYVINNS